MSDPPVLMEYSSVDQCHAILAETIVLLKKRETAPEESHRLNLFNRKTLPG
jgi:hypothetical protein